MSNTHAHQHSPISTHASALTHSRISTHPSALTHQHSPISTHASALTHQHSPISTRASALTHQLSPISWLPVRGGTGEQDESARSNSFSRSGPLETTDSLAYTPKI